MSDWGKQGPPAGQSGRVKVPAGQGLAADLPSIAEMKPLGYHADGTPYWVRRTAAAQRALDDTFIAARVVARGKR